MSQYYFALRSLHKALPSTTSYYKACTRNFPVLLHTPHFTPHTSHSTLSHTTKHDLFSLFPYLVGSLFVLGHLQQPPLQPPCNHGAACCKYGKYGKFLSEVGGLISYKPNIYVFISFFKVVFKKTKILKLLLNYLAYLAFSCFQICVSCACF